MVNECCSRRCDFREECTVAFFCDGCSEPIDDEEEYYEIKNLKLCENCWDKHVDKHFLRIAHREVD